MAGRKQNAAAMKAAKQKKIAIGGAVLLIGIMVIQGPKMLKLLSGGSKPAAGGAPPVSATPAGAAAPAVAPVPAVPPTGAAPVTPAATAPSGTKLVSFERFSSKDPF